MGKKKLLVVFFTILLSQLSLYIFLTLRTYNITPAGRLHIAADEHAYYVGAIRQSMHGEWTHAYQYTTLPTAKIYNYIFYVGAGKVSALFHIDPVVMYEIVRITGAIAVMLATFWLIVLMLPATVRIPAIIFTMVFETGPVWSELINKQISTIWFLEPRIYRHFYIAHHTWAEAFALLLIGVIFRSIQKPSPVAPVVIALLAVFSTLTSPTFALIVVPCLLIPWIIWSIVTKTWKLTVPPVLLAIFSIGAAGLFMKFQLAADPSWGSASVVEKTWWSTEYILLPFLASYTLLYPFFALLLLLIPFTWKHWSAGMRRIFVLFFCFSVLPIGLIVISAYPWFPVSNGRIATDLGMVPLSILSSLVFYAVGLAKPLHTLLKRLITGLLLVATVLSLLLSAIYFRQILQKQDMAVDGTGRSWVEYPTTDLWNGMMALKNVPLWSHIMVNPRIGAVLPVYLPVYVYEGPTALGDSTIWFKQRGLSYIFYTGEMSRDDLKQLITENKISYVFHGPEEKSALKTSVFYPDILEVMYQNREVTVYKVRLDQL